jgi:acyl-coenzyme A synthetase/AMP-(fatty) acid ligase
MHHEHSSYEEIYGRFRWVMPDRYNIGVDVCDRHATGIARTALIVEEEDASVSSYEYPRRIAFVDELPTTATGKIMRRLLRQRAIDEGVD